MNTSNNILEVITCLGLNKDDIIDKDNYIYYASFYY